MADLRSILISNAGLIGQGVGVSGATPLGTMWASIESKSENDEFDDQFK